MANNCTRDTLKSFFETGDVPTQAQFEDFIESVPNLSDNNTLSGYNHFETGIHVGNLSGGSAVVQASSSVTGLMLAGSEGAQTTPGDEIFGANIELKSHNHPTLSSKAFYDAASHTFRDQTASDKTTLFVNGSACISSGLSSNGNTFTVEPLNSRVGINTNIPDTTLDVDGHSQVHVSPDNKVDNAFVFSVKADNKTGASTELIGPTKIVHDLFKHSGETCGFGDKSNHFHDIVRINKITQDGTGENLNLERTQQQYYAVTSNVLRNENAAFLNHSRVTRSVNNTDVAMTNLTGWDVSDIEDSSNRSATSQVPFTQSESTFMTFTAGNNPFILNDLLQITIDTEFQGAIVAATLFSKVISVNNTGSGDRAEIKLYSGNYKTTNEVAKQKTQTSLSAEFSVEKIDSSHYMALATGTGATVTTDNTRLYANDSFTLEFDSSQDLKLNDVITLLTDGTNGFQSAEVATVTEIITTGTKFKFVYGPLRFSKDNLELTTLPNSSIVGVLKGSLDGLHRMTIGDSFYNFFSDNSGRYDTFTIGPGTQADNLTGGNIAIGKNIYNSKAGTILFGYENNTMTLSSDGSVGIGTNTPNKTLTVIGDISATGTLTVPNLETNVEVSDFTVNGGFSADGNTFTVEDTNNRVGIGTNTPNKTLTVVGDVSAEGDLNIDSDTLFVDASTDKVGINTLIPNKDLTVVGDISGTSRVSIGCNNTVTTCVNVAVVGGFKNTANGDNSIIAGGCCSTTGGENSIIAGGQCNITTNTGDCAAIVGGSTNTAAGLRSIVGGGFCACASNTDTAVVGGVNNTASGARATIIGGQLNVASNDNSIVGGGNKNTASGDRSLVVGGDENIASGTNSAIVGSISGIANCDNSFIGGGACNTVSNINTAVIGGLSGTASGVRSTVVGGISGEATGSDSSVIGGSENISSGVRSAIVGGGDNDARNDDSGVAGGNSNSARGIRSFIAGGYFNTACGTNSFIGGGNSNESHELRTFVGGGRSNRACGVDSGILAGCNNLITATGTCSIILGSNITASSPDTTFVNNLSSTGDINALSAQLGELSVSCTCNGDIPGFFVRGTGDGACAGYVGIGKSNPTIPLHVVHPNSSAASGSIGEALRVVGSTLLTTKGDTVLTIQAESDSTGDDDEPLLKLRKGLTNAGEACLAIHGAGNEYSGKITDAVYLKASKDGIACSDCENIQFVVNETAGITLAGSTSKIPNVIIGDCVPLTHYDDDILTLSKATTAANFLKINTQSHPNRQGICFEKSGFDSTCGNLGEIRWVNNCNGGQFRYTAGITVSAAFEGSNNGSADAGGITVFHNKSEGNNAQPYETMRIIAKCATSRQPGVVITQGLSANNTLFVPADSNAVSVAGSLSGVTLSAGNGFTGTGPFSNFTIQDGIIIAAS